MVESRIIMVKLNRIYTRTGDDGTTGLGTGERRPKYDVRVSAYGTVDETNACIGMVRLYTASPSDEGLGAIDVMLGRIQNDLFDLGADLCCPHTDEPLPYEPLRITPAQVTRIETEIDLLNAELSPLNSFILPGGSPAAAMLHLARTVCRRAERLTVELTHIAGERVSPTAVNYLNRLSDFLFVASRYVNDKGAKDVLWVPGKNR
jgi:cob(I)alamin adenosyltransferase